MNPSLHLTIQTLNHKSDLQCTWCQSGCYQLVLVHQGSLKILLGDKELSVSKDHLLFSNAGQATSVLHITGIITILEFDAIYYHGFTKLASSLVSQELTLNFVSSKIVAISYAHYLKFLQIIDDVTAELHHGRDGTLLQSQLNLLLAYAHKASQEKKPGTPGVESLKIFTRLSALLDEHFKEHHKTEWYAREIGISIRKLNRVANDHAGQAVPQLILERMVRAGEWELVHHPEHPIKIIAFELGFKEPGHFSTYFKRLHGLTPLQFRKKHTK